MRLKGKVTAHPAKGCVTVEVKDLPPFNAVVVFDMDPPEIGSEIEVEARKAPTIVDGKGIEIVEHATHVRPAKSAELKK